VEEYKLIFLLQLQKNSRSIGIYKYR